MELQMLPYQPMAVVEQAGEGCALEENLAVVRAAGRLGEPKIKLATHLLFSA
jgi:hypothetical protein